MCINQSAALPVPLISFATRQDYYVVDPMWVYVIHKTHSSSTENTTTYHGLRAMTPIVIDW